MPSWSSPWGIPRTPRPGGQPARKIRVGLEGKCGLQGFRRDAGIIVAAQSADVLPPVVHIFRIRPFPVGVLRRPVVFAIACQREDRPDPAKLVTRAELGAILPQ